MNASEPNEDPHSLNEKEGSPIPNPDSLQQASLDVTREFSFGDVDPAGSITTPLESDGTTRLRGPIDEPGDELTGETISLTAYDGKTFGHFQLLERLGEGGFGVVYRGHDDRLNRDVAIKVAFHRASVSRKDHFARVFHEGRATAALDHPNIVKIYDIAERDGYPYIISQLIDGVTLRDRMNLGRIPQRQVVRMMILISRALGYAHQHGVIHRDMKPGNVLLDAEEVPYVNDFGIAKQLRSDQTIASSSGSGSVIGTPAYMSPEQAAGRSSSVDQRSDLFSLGVILYEMLTGEKPFRGSARMRLQHILHSDPPQPRQLDQNIPRDLETICLRCLEKSPDKRYQSCEDLALELERFEKGEPIQARPITRLERFLRKCRRNPVITSVSASLVVAVLAGFAGVSWQWIRAEKSRVHAVQARQQTEAANRKLAVEVNRSNALINDMRMRIVSDAMFDGDHRQAKLVMSQITDVKQPDFRLLKHLSKRYRVAFKHLEPVTQIAVSEDDAFVAGAGVRTILVWDAAAKQIVFRHRQPQKVRGIDFCPGRSLLAWGLWSGQIHLVDLAESGKAMKVLDHGGPVTSIRFSESGDQLLVCGGKGNVSIWSVVDRKQRSVIEDLGSRVNQGAFVEDDRVLLGLENGDVVISNVDGSSRETLFSSRSAVTTLDVSKERAEFAVGCFNGRFAIVPFAKPGNARVLYSSSGPLQKVRFFEKKNMVITSHHFGNVCVRSLDRLENFRSYDTTDIPTFAMLNQSDDALVSAADSLLKINLQSTAPDLIVTDQGGIEDLHVSGDVLVVCHQEGPATLMQLEDRSVLRQIPGAKDKVPSTFPKTVTCVASQESRLVFGTDDGRLVIWNSVDDSVRVMGSRGNRAIVKIKSIADDQVLTAGVDGALRSWNLESAQSSKLLSRFRGVIRDLDVCPTKSIAVVATADQTVATYDWEKGEELERLNVEKPVSSCAISEDGGQIMVGYSNGAVEVFGEDLERRLVKINHYSGQIREIELSRGASRIFAASGSAVVVMNPATGFTGASVSETELMNLRSIELSQDERWLISGDVSGSIAIFEIPLEQKGNPDR